MMGGNVPMGVMPGAPNMQPGQNGLGPVPSQPAATAVPFNLPQVSQEYVENISPSPRHVPVAARSAVEEPKRHEDDDDDMSSFLQSLPTTMKEASPTSHDAFSDALDDSDHHPLPAAKPPVARQLFKDSPSWDYKAAPPSTVASLWDQGASASAVPSASGGNAGSFGAQWGEPEVALGSSDGSPTKGRSTFLRKANEDPVVYPTKKKAPAPAAPTGGIDMSARVRIAFESVRRRMLEIPLAERGPLPFETWAAMMSKADSELEADVNFSIDDVLHEAEMQGLIATGSADASSEGRYVLYVGDREVSCLLCGVRAVDTVLQPCHHSICALCLKNNAVQPIGIIGPALYKTCPFCAKPIQRQDTIAPNSTPSPASFMGGTPVMLMPQGAPTTSASMRPVSLGASWDAPAEPSWGTVDAQWMPPSAMDASWPPAPAQLPSAAPSAWPEASSSQSSMWNAMSRSQDEYFMPKPQGSNLSGNFMGGAPTTTPPISRPVSTSGNLAPLNANTMASNTSNASSIWGSTMNGISFFSSNSS